MTILIVDDHPIVLKGIHALLASSFAEAHIIDAAGVGEAEQMLNRHKVDIIITDLDLNGESGSILIEHVRNVQPATQVAIYTMHEGSGDEERQRCGTAHGSQESLCRQRLL